MIYTMRRFFLLSVLIFPAGLFAQHVHFLQEGFVEFEKRINVHTLMIKAIGEPGGLTNWGMEYIKSKPAFKVDRKSVV